MPTGDVNNFVWNKACDIYVARFLADIGFGKPVIPDPSAEYSIKLNDEIKIYAYRSRLHRYVGNGDDQR